MRRVRALCSSNTKLVYKFPIWAGGGHQTIPVPPQPPPSQVCQPPHPHPQPPPHPAGGRLRASETQRPPAFAVLLERDMRGGLAGASSREAYCPSVHGTPLQAQPRPLDGPEARRGGGGAQQTPASDTQEALPQTCWAASRVEGHTPKEAFPPLPVPDGAWDRLPLPPSSVKDRTGLGEGRAPGGPETGLVCPCRIGRQRSLPGPARPHL